jgi:hypothetical protein
MENLELRKAGKAGSVGALTHAPGAVYILAH